MKYKKFTIVGVGLIGGAIGLEVKDKNLAEEVWGWGRNKDHLDLAIHRGACDEVTTDLKQAVTDSDFIVLATPPKVIKKQLTQIKSYLKKEALIIDVGSVKQTIVKEAEKSLKNLPVEFVGCHPMAGSEKTGVKNTYKNMFKDAPCIVTQTGYNTEKKVSQVADFWKNLGGNVIFTEPEEHDLMVAFVSHLPHIMATSLINSTYINIKDGEKIGQISGPSFRNITRFGAASEELWSQIYRENKSSVLKTVRELKKSLEKFEKILSGGNSKELKKILKKARLKREEL
ncbi:MAG: prephenate dehydrogenase [Elusimicrobiota bacterium]